MIDIPKDYLENLRKPKNGLKITGERQELIQSFVEKINLERIGTKWNPVTWRQINGLVSHVKMADVYWLFKECEQGDSFSKKFFGILKSKRVKK